MSVTSTFAPRAQPTSPAAGPLKGQTAVSLRLSAWEGANRYFRLVYVISMNFASAGWPSNFM